MVSKSSEFIIFYTNTVYVGTYQVSYLYVIPKSFLVPNAGVGNRLIKNNLRIFLGLRFNIFKNIEAQQKLCHSYKKKCVDR